MLSLRFQSSKCACQNAFAVGALLGPRYGERTLYYEQWQRYVRARQVERISLLLVLWLAELFL